MQLTRAAFVIITSMIFHRGFCHPNGAPISKCENMLPSHGSLPQTGRSPYIIKVTKSYYMPGENVRVTIESSGDDIKGYLIQARQVGANAVIGTFATPPAKGKYLNCGNNQGAITHSDRLAVKTINFDWVPPSGLSGNVSFYATVVKDISTFWVKLQSPELYKREMVQTSSTSTSMTNVTSAPTSVAKSSCKPNDPKCNGGQMNHSVLVIFFISLFFAIQQNVI